MKQEGFFYLRQWKTKKPIGVVALRKENATQVRVAVSLCAPSDEWDRRLGVIKATARLDSKSSMLVELCGTVENPMTTTNIIGVLEGLMPPPSKYEAPPQQRHGVDTGIAGKTLAYQVQRLLKEST